MSLSANDRQRIMTDAPNYLSVTFPETENIIVGEDFPCQVFVDNIFHLEAEFHICELKLIFDERTLPFRKTPMTGPNFAKACSYAARGLMNMS